MEAVEGIFIPLFVSPYDIDPLVKVLRNKVALKRLSMKMDEK
jgi:hypothetical protein